MEDFDEIELVILAAMNNAAGECGCVGPASGEKYCRCEKHTRSVIAARASEIRTLIASTIESMAKQEVEAIAQSCLDDHYMDDIREAARASFARIAAAIRAQIAASGAAMEAP